MNYIGSKKTLLSFIEGSINEVIKRYEEEKKVKKEDLLPNIQWLETGKHTPKKKPLTFCDLFAGTGVVGSHFKKKGYTILANDIQYYSYVLNRHYIGNCDELRFEGLSSEFLKLRTLSLPDRKNYMCYVLSQCKPIKGFIYKNYSLGGTKKTLYPRQYFSDENAQICDGIRKQVNVWKRHKKITSDEYFFLLASFLESIDHYANTTSVYGSFLKRLKRSAKESCIIKPLELIESDNAHHIFNKNASKIIKKLTPDILYLDPPYNQRQYYTNYHILETLARYDKPTIQGKTGLRQDDSTHSDFCSKKKVKAAFKKLIKSSKARYIFLSYNNEGLLSHDYIREVMSSKGDYGVFCKKHTRFQSNQMRKQGYSTSSTLEYLHYVVCN